MPLFGLSLLLHSFKVNVFKDAKSSFEFYKNETAPKPLFVRHQSFLVKWKLGVKGNRLNRNLSGK